MGSPLRLALPAFALVVAHVAFAASPALAGDIIINSKGQPLGNPKAGNPPGKDDFNGSQWEVLDESLDGVTYRIPEVPQPQTIPASSVRAVYYDPASIPGDLARGKQLQEQGNAAGAREAYVKVAKDAGAAPWAKAEAAFRAATTLLDEGNAAEAEKAMGAFKSAFPKSRWVTQATEKRAFALLAMEKIDDAKAEFGSLTKLPGVSDDAKTEVEYWIAWIDEQVAARKKDQGAIANVLKAYDNLISKLSGKAQFADLSLRCQVGKASCLILLGKAAEARDILEKLVGETKDPRTLCAIYNKLGTATWRASPTDKVAQRAALLHYLHAFLRFGEAAGAEEDCAESMFHAGELFRELKDKEDWPARARREWNEVIAQFPGSAWAQRSKEALAGR